MGFGEWAAKRVKVPASVFWLGVVSFLNDFSSEMIFPLLPLFFTSVLGAGPAALGAMEGLVESVSSLLKLWSGHLADRLPRRKPIVVGGYSLASVSRPFIAVATAPWQVIALRVFDRVGKGLRTAPRDALLADSLQKENRGRGFGFHRAMDHLGAIAGPLTALAIIPLFFGPGDLHPHEYRILFAVAAVPALASLLVLGFLVKEPPRQTPAEGSEPGGSRALGGGFWYLMALVVIFTLGNSSDAFLLLRARGLGLTPKDLYLLWALLHLVKATLSTPAGALSDRVPRRYLIAGGWLAYALVYLGFGHASAAWHVWALFAAYGIFFGLTEGTEKALVADLVPASSRGVAYGWYNASLGLAAFPASALFGLLWRWRGPSLAFTFGACLALAASLLLLLHPPETMRRPA
ncbi:MAG TPA: MFS transporter [Armatimonadota bacterium]|jgi:MFS family permease